VSAVIEDARLKDLDRLYAIERECFNEEAFSREQISQLLSDDNTISLVARAANGIVGFVIVMIYPDRKMLHGHILTIDVVPTQRRKGVGSLLMSEIERIFAAKGVEASYLEVREDNEPAINLYLKLGYEIIGKLDHYYGKHHGLYLRKSLA
jgi:ribosomal-protein-alanine N-acetyltransferase